MSMFSGSWPERGQVTSIETIDVALYCEIVSIFRLWEARDKNHPHYSKFVFVQLLRLNMKFMNCGFSKSSQKFENEQIQWVLRPASKNLKMDVRPDNTGRTIGQCLRDVMGIAMTSLRCSVLCFLSCIGLANDPGEFWNEKRKQLFYLEENSECKLESSTSAGFMGHLTSQIPKDFIPMRISKFSRISIAVRWLSPFWSVFSC